MIAESPISDARAKSEARRAKILAREAARLSAGKGEKQEGNNETAVTAENEDETPKGRGRPLAARRSLVTKTTSDEIKESSVDAAVDIKDSDGNDVDTAAASPVTVPAATINITSTRTREIEKEIAGHNASHDKAIAQEPKEASPVLPLVKKQIKAISNPLQPFQIMRLIRLIAIILLAAVTGYRSSMNNMEEIVKFSENHQKQEVTVVEPTDEMSEKLFKFLHKSDLAPIVGTPDFYGNRLDTMDSSRRSWMEWGQSKITSYSESSLSAVAIVWWASSILSPILTKTNGQKGTNIMNMVISFYNNGMDGVVDTVLSRVGEVCVHITVLIAVPMIMTHLTMNPTGSIISEAGLNPEL